jgi:hypothetical protein
LFCSCLYRCPAASGGGACSTACIITHPMIQHYTPQGNALQPPSPSSPRCSSASPKMQHCPPHPTSLMRSTVSLPTRCSFRPPSRCTYSISGAAVLNGAHSVLPFRSSRGQSDVVSDPHPGAVTVHGGPLYLMGSTVFPPSDVVSGPPSRCSYSTWGAQCSPHQM